jgi:hypothetical protein
MALQLKKIVEKEMISQRERERKKWFLNKKPCLNGTKT